MAQNSASCHIKTQIYATVHNNFLGIAYRPWVERSGCQFRMNYVSDLRHWLHYVILHVVVVLCFCSVSHL